MGYRMKYKITNKDEPFLQDEMLVQKNWAFLKEVEKLVNAQPEYYATRALLVAAIPNPSDRQRAYVIGQGECRYKTAVADWVLIADDTTVIV